MNAPRRQGNAQPADAPEGSAGHPAQTSIGSPAGSTGAEMPRLSRIRRRLVVVGLAALAMVGLAVAASMFELANERLARQQYQSSLAMTQLAFDAQSLAARLRSLATLRRQHDPGQVDAAAETLRSMTRTLDVDRAEWERRTTELMQTGLAAPAREHLAHVQSALSDLQAAPGEGIEAAYLAAIEAAQSAVLASVRGSGEHPVVGSYTVTDLSAALVTGASLLALVLGGALIALVNQAQQESRAALGIMGELLRTDPLTGVTNRRGLDENLPVEMARARRGSLPLTVAMLDLDYFKRYNSRRGHGGGDALLRTAAQSWRRQLRPTDMLVRYGGEEFTLVLPSCGSEQACQLIARLRPLMPDNQTFSAGVATWDYRESGDDLIRRADHALLEAKKNGRNRTVVSGQEEQIALPLTAS